MIIDVIISRRSFVFGQSHAKVSAGFNNVSSLAVAAYDRVPCPGGGGALPYKRLMGMCRWMLSHFHDWIDYNGVAFSTELLQWIPHFRIFGVRKFFIFTVSKHTRMFVL